MTLREIAPLVVFAAMLPLALRALWLSDRLFQGLYLRHRELWRQLGRPSGWMWRAPNGALLTGMRISLGLLKRKPPAWLAGAPDLQAIYSACRRTALLWNLVAMPIWILTTLVFSITAP